ncbi:MAG: DUF1836 domain-containing protein [Bacillaceae bacterium]|jgi:Domain of unknown function (DUF1836).|uniref:DUF1836 domain-containing protein n=1 Tax=Aeribacillus composti TaxID=1868734 RepID=A0ABY9WHV5_9BACI|nr:MULTISPECIES: DUF1836 domain-containing protein [Aeribacillus]REJ14218.1 MAG: DUF1836 domain-containing protein [Bacillaceae bacterium]KZM53951.1 hypothetical protein A3Q35_16060 [Aeribacillus pallidus]MED0651942.1 DUF1836 domain-containing protein [Aeribacillus composti]MED0702586.1 DUF1836 domain-containing protein [Aeribacillus composti]MED1439263.1 DUF1836 domain-containing protein [Aeribacillus composti]
MGKIQLRRSVMVQLLLSLKGIHELSPEEVMKQQLPSDQTNQIPGFIKKLSKQRDKGELGLSTNEIVILGNFCELTSLKSTSVQNWVKRDIKEIIGPPELGKKYSVEQAALLLIVKDLKTIFDFETVRSLLMKVFNTISDRNDDLISPLMFYKLYTDVLEQVKNVEIDNNRQFEKKLFVQTKRLLQKQTSLSEAQIDSICHVTVAAVLAVLTYHFQTRAKAFIDKESESKKIDNN